MYTKNTRKGKTMDSKSSPLGSGVLGSIFTLMDTIIGITFLSMSYIFMTTGIGIGVLIFVILSLIFGFSVMIMIPVYMGTVGSEVRIQQTNTTNPKIKESMIIQNNMFHLILKYMGREAQQVMAIIVFISTFSTMTAFVVGAVGIWQGLISTWAPDINPNREYIVLVVAGIMFPLMFIRTLRAGVILSAVSIVIMIYMTVCVIIRSAQNMESWGENSSFGPVSPQSNGGLAILTSLPVVTFALTCQMNIFTIFSEIDINKTKKMTLVNQMKVVTFVGIFLSAFIYMLIGIFGYLQFGNSTTDNILTLYDNNDILMQTVKVLISVKLLFTVPLMSNPMISAAEHLVLTPQLDGITETWKMRSIAIIITWILSVGLSLATDNLVLIFGIAGSLSDTIISFIFPGWIFKCFMKDIKLNNKKHLINNLFKDSISKNNSSRIAVFLITFGYFMIWLCSMSSLWFSDTLKDFISPQPAQFFTEGLIFAVVGMALFFAILVLIVWTMSLSFEQKETSVTDKK